MVKKNGNTGLRSFTIEKVGKQGSCMTKGSGGRFISKGHLGAASKAFTKLCRMKKIKGQCTLLVSMRETTRGSACKVRSYMCKRMKLAKPLVMKAGTPSEYKIHYASKVKAVKKADTIPCKQKKSVEKEE